MILDVEKCLEVIVNVQDLGVGFVFVIYDLEICGVGELFGDGQSGQIQVVGFIFYMEMFEWVVKVICKGEQLNFEQLLGGGLEVNLWVFVLIFEDYLFDVYVWLIFYKCIVNVFDEEGLCELQVEMIDCFGFLFDLVKNLMCLIFLKLQVEKFGIFKVDVGLQGGCIEFVVDIQVDLLVLIKLIQGQLNCYKFEGVILFCFQVFME